jgi:hypothetical protein
MGFERRRIFGDHNAVHGLGGDRFVSFARSEPGPLHQFDARAVRAGDVEEADRRSVRQIQRTRLARKLRLLAIEHRLGLVDRAGRSPADVIDRASLARRRRPLRCDDVHRREAWNAGVLHRVDLSLDLRAIAAELSSSQAYMASVSGERS